MSDTDHDAAAHPSHFLRAVIERDLHSGAHDGRRRVREIAGVPGRVEEGVVEVEEIFGWRSGRLVRTDGYPPHADRFARAGFDLPCLLSGASGAGR